MKWLATLAVLAAALWAVFALAFPDHAHRFRLTVEVDTPGGLRSRSSVIEVERKDVRWAPAPGQYMFAVRGEGVFLDLGGGRDVVALLAHGANAEWVSNITPFWIEAYGRERSEEDDVWSGRKELRGVVELKPPLIPTLVTFADPLDPTTVWAVQPHEFEAVFGPGFRFRRATLEMVPTGWWPASALGLSGVPYTHGVIQRHLPWLAGMKTNLAGKRNATANDIRERLPPLEFTRQAP